MHDIGILINLFYIECVNLIGNRVTYRNTECNISCISIALPSLLALLRVDGAMCQGAKVQASQQGGTTAGGAQAATQIVD